MIRLNLQVYNRSQSNQCCLGFTMHKNCVYLLI